MPTGAAVLGAGVEVAKVISSAHNLKKEKEELAKLHPAFYKIQDEYFQNKNIAGSLAQGGFTQTTKDFFTSGVELGLGSSMNALLKAGGSPNDIAGLMDVYGRSISGFGAEEGDRHIKNIQYFMDKNKELAGQKTTQWAVNEYQPYQAKLKEITERRAADTQNLWGGMEGVVGAASAYGTGQSNAKLMAKLFGDGKGGVSDPNEPEQYQGGGTVWSNNNGLIL